jgi:endonuclease/exonuclease/phosphatase family metal-dependent hydrolase
MRHLFLLLSLLFTGLHATAMDVKLLSWNVYLLPSPIKKSRQKERIELIVNRLQTEQSYDIMVFQEAFMGSFRKKLTKALAESHPHVYHMGRGGKFLSPFASGLFIASRYPFKIKDKVYYSKCSGADCFATKGALMAEVELPQERKIQVVVTHMQSGQKDKQRKIRAHQIDELKTFMSKNARTRVPQVLVGDLNINALSADEFPEALTKLEFIAPVNATTAVSGASVEASERSSFLENLRAFFSSSRATETECFGMERKDEPKRVDHVWVPQHEEKLRISQLEVTPLRSEFNGKDCDLSDHLPLSVVFDLE